MSVTARFFIRQLTRSSFNPDARQIELSAVSRGPENRTWAKYTPSGTIEMNVLNPVASAWFEQMMTEGKDLVIDISARPPICDRCHEEVPDSAQGHTSYDNDGAAVFTHADDCSNVR